MGRMVGVGLVGVAGASRAAFGALLRPVRRRVLAGLPGAALQPQPPRKISAVAGVVITAISLAVMQSKCLSWVYLRD